MTGKYLIKWSGRNHDVQKWAKDRGVKDGKLYPAPFQIADKPGGKKGRRIPYDNAKLADLYKLNGNNKKIFQFITRIGGWLFNDTNNRHLKGKLKGLLPKWLGKFADNYVPYPLPKGKKAFAEPIYCESNIVVVDKIKGKWAHITPGIAHLVQVSIGYGTRHPSTNVRWRVPAGWCELSKLEKL